MRNLTIILRNPISPGQWSNSIPELVLFFFLACQDYQNPRHDLFLRDINPSEVSRVVVLSLVISSQSKLKWRIVIRQESENSSCLLFPGRIVIKPFWEEFIYPSWKDLVYLLKASWMTIPTIRACDFQEDSSTELEEMDGYFFLSTCFLFFFVFTPFVVSMSILPMKSLLNSFGQSPPPVLQRHLFLGIKNHRNDSSLQTRIWPWVVLS